MTAPPLPPRISGIQVWTRFQNDSNVQSSNNVAVQRPTDVTLATRHVYNNQVLRGTSPPPPPLPPRRWVGNSDEDIDELTLVPPPPSQAAFKEPSNDLMSFHSPLCLSRLNPTVSSSIPISVPIPRLNGAAVPPNSPNWFTPVFTNELYFHRSSCQVSQDKVSVLPFPPQVDVPFPHSHSAPDLAQLKSEDSRKALLDNVMGCMKKKRDSNLIDLFTHEEVFKEQLLFRSRVSRKDDILELFDPLAVVSSPPSPIPSPEEEDKIEMDAHPPEDSVDAPKECVVVAELNLYELPDDQLKTKSLLQSQSGFDQLRVVPRSVTVSAELIHFAEKVRNLRREFLHDDYHTNVGFVVSPTLENNREEPLSVQVVINSVFADPVSFACDVNTSIEHIISHAVCTVFDHVSNLDMESFVLKVKGVAEYFTADTTLAEYEYVHQCHKVDKPVQLTLVRTDDLDRSLSRSAQDDKRDTSFGPDDILEDEPLHPVQFNSINILLETLHKEIGKLRKQAKLKFDLLPQLQGVVQATKALCSCLSRIETIEISMAISNLNLSVLNFTKFRVEISHRADEEVDILWRLDQALLHLLECMEQLLMLYCKTFRVNFHLPRINLNNQLSRDVTLFLDSLLVHLGSLHQLPPHWSTTYQSILVKSELRHGKDLLCAVSSNKVAYVAKSFFEWASLDEWIDYPNTPMCGLQREARLYFFVYGIKAGTADDSGSSPARQLLGWTAMTLFNHKQQLSQGSYLLGLWPEEVRPSSGPAVPNVDSSAVILRITLPEYEFNVQFPDVSSIDIQVPRGGKFEMLDHKTQYQIVRIAGSDLNGLLAEEEKELLWEKRHFLKDKPQVLPKLLFSVHSWEWACLPEVYSALRDWQHLSPVESLVLLLPDFPDLEVRSTAVRWTKNIGSDELCDYLPQLVQALRFENWLDSSVVWFLLERALTSIRVAHNLYWLLKQDLRDPLNGRRVRVVLNALKLIVGSALRDMFQRQGLLLGSLSAAAERVKTTKESLRLSALYQELDTTRHILQENPTCLPLSPSQQVCSVDVKDCGYFTSNTLPLRIVFRSAGDSEHRIISIYKVGDDLRQDMLTLQMIRIMDKLWLKEGLDLKIVTFGCFSTALKEGVVEMVTEADTLRKIQTEHGLTGSFKDRPIAEWLQKHNTSELEYQKAVENFTLSCAGYCVATYVLGICDRHNDNIMLKTSGHVFHIDFGKFLGDSQKIGNIKRDRVPFVLTSDMAYVINGGDRPSKMFQHFIDTCCSAFNILRRRSSVFLNLFALMAESAVPGLNTEAFQYVEKALLPWESDAEATGRFARMVEESLRSWSTQVNFFFHNLAQLRFTGDHGDESLLSFIPKTFTKESDGKVCGVAVTMCQKRFDPEKYYVYEVRIEREGQADALCIYRSYPEFCEFHQKLGMLFPLAKFPALKRGSFVVRSNIREVAEIRRTSLASFMTILMDMAEEIAHCPLVYTFLHPILRDQEGVPQNWSKKAVTQTDSPLSPSVVQGNVKLSIVYKNNSLFIMIMHAKNLVGHPGVPPDSYVKAYLTPDPHKLTKRKTKVVAKNSHPTFMEMLVYRLPYEVIRRRTLSISVWNHDRVQENGFLGASLIALEDLDLKKETIRWYTLECSMT